MKNKIKIIICFLMIILFTGCSADSVIKINEDGTVNEKITVLDVNENFVSDTLPITDYIKSLFYPYQQQSIEKGYESKVYTDMFESGVKFTKTYSSICDYFNNSVFMKEAYKNLVCVNNKDFYEVKSVPDYNVDNSAHNLDSFKKIKLSIESDLRVLDQNGNENKKRVYNWNFDKEKDNVFYLKIKKSNNVIDNIINKGIDKKIIIIPIILLVTIITFSFLYKKYKRNKIDY